MLACIPYTLWNTKIGPISLGLMGFSRVPDKKAPQQQVFDALKKSIQMGQTFGMVVNSMVDQIHIQTYN